MKGQTKKFLATGFCLLLLAVLSASIITANSSSATVNNNKANSKLVPVVIKPVKVDLSPSLRSIQATIPPEKIKELQIKEKPIHLLPKGMKKNLTITPDPLVKSEKMNILATPAPSLVYEGLSNIDNYNTIGYRVLPPDTEGDVGPNYYVEMINLILAIYSKDGTKVFGPIPNNAIWTGFGGACEGTNSGDPIVLYDHLADRWLVSQFSTAGPPYHQCIAISQSSDPTGSYYRYDYEWEDDKFPDYPKLGVWIDGYYMAANQFTSGWAGQGVAAFERDKMLLGQTAQMIYFDLEPININYGGMLPTDLDGPPPAAGTPNYYAEVDDEDWIPPTDAIRIWEFHVDWANPANSTFGISGEPNYILDTAAWEPLPCVSAGSRDCIPQPGVSSSYYLDSLGDRLMYRLQYRNFGNQESLVVNHTVWADSADRAGVRWYRILLSGTTECSTFPCIWQQTTHAPADGYYRWMGSAALDNTRNLCVGYSLSSSAVYPSIAYACWLPDGTYDGEQTMYTGSGSQTHSASRWGDYSTISVDPSNECSFWYITEYYYQTNELCPTTASTACWHTRIGSFKYPSPSCTTPAKCLFKGYVIDASTTAPIPNALVKAGAYSKVTNGVGYYEIYVQPGAYDMEASAVGYTASYIPAIDCSSGIVEQNFYLNGVPLATFAGVTFVDSCPYPSPGNGDGVVDPGESITVSAYLKNDGHASITDAVGSLSTISPYININDPNGAWPVIAPGNMGVSSDNFSFNVDLSAPCGTTVNFNLDVSYSGGGPLNAGFISEVGLTQTSVLLSEDFSAGIPSQWTTISNGSCVYPWTGDNPCSRTPGSPFDTFFAIADSDCSGSSCGTMDEELITPSIDASSCTGVILSFSNWYSNLDDIADVDVSSDGGLTWTNVLQMTSDDGYPTPNTKVIDISAIAAQQPNVKIRWHYYNADWAWYWAIDNVNVECEGAICNPCAAPTNINPVGKLVDTIGNGIFEPGETVVFAPTWQNNEAYSISLTGTVSNFTGPAAATYTILDAESNYGSIASGSSSNCTNTGDCYVLYVSVPASRPTHWDSTIDETLNIGPTNTWTIHIGDSFNDVPKNNIFYSSIEKLLHSNIASGCTSTNYCPSGLVKRDQMAKFICNSMEATSAGSCTLSGSCQGIFADVPQTNPFCQHIEALAATGVVSGCGGGNYCPSINTLRDQMAKFICSGMETANPGSCVVGPCTGIFGDVSSSNAFCPFIEQLYILNVVSGCQTTPLLYCPSNTVSRDQMAKFIVNGFGFTL